MKRWQKAVLAVLTLVVLAVLWLLDAFTAANAHRLWRTVLVLFTVAVFPAPLVAAAHAAYRRRDRWFRYGLTGVIAATLYPLLNLVLLLTRIAPGETYPFIPASTVLLVGAPPEAVSTGPGLTFLFLAPTAVRVLPLAALPLVHHYAVDRADRTRLLAITAVPLLIATFWLVTLAATLAGVCVPVCGLPQ